MLKRTRSGNGRPPRWRQLSMQAWKPYEQWLGPLFEALAPVLGKGAKRSA